MLAEYKCPICQHILELIFTRRQDAPEVVNCPGPGGKGCNGRMLKQLALSHFVMK